MATLTLVLGMLVVVTLAASVARLVPALPLPLVQIAVGCVIALFTGSELALDPELFFLLFLPPLLFLDGWRLPKDEIRGEMRTVVGLATALVLCTVLGVGALVHQLLPALPWAVAFALAAVLAPTDPVAVSAITGGVAVPRRMMRVLQGEALLNDASGLTCLQFAVAAAVTGMFSLPDALGTFAWMAVGGLAIGSATVLITLKISDLLIRRFGPDGNAQILVSLLLPFAAYLLGEHAHASGILAAVGAGVAMTFGNRLTAMGAETRVQSASVWEFVETALNGTIFVLLGSQLPRVSRAAGLAAAEADGWTRLAITVAAILAALIAIRFAWSIVAFRPRRRADAGPPLDRRTAVRLRVAFSLGGVKGAVTLAGILTLPTVLASGAPFPGRDIAIFLAASVIIASLVVASVALPPTLRGLTFGRPDTSVATEHQLRNRLLDTSVAAVLEAGRANAETDPRYAVVARREAERLDRLRPLDHAHEDDSVQELAIERELKLVGLRAAREEAARLVRHGEAGSALAHEVIRELDLAELRLGR